jgi:hypothetical protein
MVALTVNPRLNSFSLVVVFRIALTAIAIPNDEQPYRLSARETYELRIFWCQKSCASGLAVAGQLASRRVHLISRISHPVVVVD